MPLTKLLSLLLVIGLSGCSSSSTPNHYEPGCRKADGYCLVELAAHAINNKNSTKKCSDMQGEQRKSCDAQVASLKKHISDASK